MEVDERLKKSGKVFTNIISLDKYSYCQYEVWKLFNLSKTRPPDIILFQTWGKHLRLLLCKGRHTHYSTCHYSWWLLIYFDYMRLFLVTFSVIYTQFCAFDLIFPERSHNHVWINVQSRSYSTCILS